MVEHATTCSFPLHCGSNSLALLLTAAVGCAHVERRPAMADRLCGGFIADPLLAHLDAAAAAVPAAAAAAAAAPRPVLVKCASQEYTGHRAGGARPRRARRLGQQRERQGQQSPVPTIA